MAVSPQFRLLLEDLLRPAGPILVRRMFSGAGVFLDGLMFAIAVEDTLYLKTDERSRAAFEAEGSRPFEFSGKGRRVSTSYWQVPERLLDDPDELLAWSRIAIGVARKGSKPKPPRRPRHKQK